MVKSASALNRLYASVFRPAYHWWTARKWVAFAQRIGSACIHPRNNDSRKKGPIIGRQLMKNQLRLPDCGTLGLAAALLFGSPVIAQSQPAPTPAPIKIGVVTFLTGPA